MLKPESKLTLDNLINLHRFPLNNLSGQSGCQLVKYCQESLAENGYILLKEFTTQDALERARIECNELSPLAEYTVRYTNPYKTEDDPNLPLDHPKRHFSPRTNAFIVQSNFGDRSVFRTLYHSEIFKRFLAACIGLDIVYEYADPLGALVFNVLPSGGQHPWHFDENDFSIVLMIQPSEKGGVFEIAPNIRTFKSENYQQVKQVLKGDSQRIKAVGLNPGDLIVFNGKVSLHRVTKVVGSKERHTIVFSYTQKEGIVGRFENNSKIFSVTNV
ncbi:MAG: hypothetical protein AAGA46_02080 [Cyanobacteria bacterium P01_F01_bin.13]